MKRASIPRRAALAGATVLTVFACRGADLTTPPSSLSPAPAAAARNWPAGTRRSVPAACVAATTPVTAARVFDRRGGTLHFGESRLVIPPGALHEPVRISATTRGDAAATVDFQPEGLRFHRPAVLALDATGCNLPANAASAVVYIGADGEVLETIAATFNWRWREVVAPIVHFSGYAIGL